jgi:hypothetical protein
MGQLVSDVTDVLNNKKAEKQADGERKKILLQIAQDEKNKINLVKKALATQRAKHGAAGMSAGGLTEKAVLERLRGEVEEPFDEKKKTNLEKLKNVKANKKNILPALISQLSKLKNEVF